MSRTLYVLGAIAILVSGLTAVGWTQRVQVRDFVTGLTTEPPPPRADSIVDDTTIDQKFEPAATTFLVEPSSGNGFSLGGGLNDGGRLTLRNKTRLTSIVKLVEESLGRKYCSVAILPGESIAIENVPAGKYRMVYAFGVSILEDRDYFDAATDCLVMDEPFVSPTSTSGVTVDIVPQLGSQKTARVVSEEDFRSF